jgi:tetratricopeptide (TPR) repeat protein
MRLNITYTNKPSSNKDLIQAAFINSNDPRIWLKELSNWGNAAADWACYAVPESMQSVFVAGLFVVTKKADLAATSPNLMWFNRVGERLYLPINAELTPSVSEAELTKLLIFDVQLFHPTIGWMGFNRADKLDLGQLLDLSLAEGADWSCAKTGIQVPPKLHQISFIQPTSNDVMQSFRDDMEQKPLKDIPFKDGSTADEEKSAFDKLKDAIKEQLLRGGISALDGLNKLLPENTTGQRGTFEAFYQSLQDRMKALEQKRESELDRLVDLFKTNPDEALKYALPLDNPYADRGVASPSNTLGTRSTDFNLGQIGGGRAVDGWNTDRHYHDLRRSYIDAANRALDSGDFRRAAYIFAHLLGDFTSAANALEQGGFYREAATLYREHLNNLVGAANCLEKGGLYLEAIELYVQVGNDEKVGDLYKRIGQSKNATNFYEKAVEECVKKRKYVEMARLEKDKLADLPRAKATLLRGWLDTNHESYELCLRQYFDLMMSESDEAAAQQIEPIFKQSPEQNLSFLSVLINQNHKFKNALFQTTARPIAYQIISEAVANGNRAAANDLEHFFPDDALIGKDAGLFMHRKR